MERNRAAPAERERARVAGAVPVLPQEYENPYSKCMALERTERGRHSILYVGTWKGTTRVPIVDL